MVPAFFALASLAGVANGCFSDTGASEPGCAEGTEACACYGNGTCDSGLRCEASVTLCVPDSCVAGDAVGAPGCLCGSAGCGDGLTCSAAGLCEVGPTTGTGDPMGTTTIATGATNPVTTDPSASTTAPTSTSASTSTATGSDTGSSTTNEPSSTTSDEDVVTLYFSRGTPKPAWLLPGSVKPAGTSAIRTAVDDRCARSLEVDLTQCNTATAIFLAGSSESIAALPVLADTRIVSNGTGQLVAEAYSDLVENGPGAALQELGVRPSNMAQKESPMVYFTGSDTSGVFDADGSCRDWESVLPTQAAVGSPTDPAHWLRDEMSDHICSQPAPLLCACWFDPSLD